MLTKNRPPPIFKSWLKINIELIITPKEETAREHRKSFSMLELDMLDIPCDSFPYIVEPYKADHWDLTDDLESRTYWLG